MSAPKGPKLTVDCVIRDKAGGGVVLIRRKHPPFQGHYALPGGFVDEGETVEQACRREVKEETNLDIDALTLVGVYSAPGRDPRGHTVSVVFYASARTENLRAGDDAASAALVKDWQNEDLAFDHASILADTFRKFPAP